jgi:hypothetical protein
MRSALSVTGHGEVGLRTLREVGSGEAGRAAHTATGRDHRLRCEGCTVRRSSTRSLAVAASAALALGLAACAPEDGAMTEDPATDGAPEGDAEGGDDMGDAF